MFLLLRKKINYGGEMYRKWMDSRNFRDKFASRFLHFALTHQPSVGYLKSTAKNAKPREFRNQMRSVEMSV